MRFQINNIRGMVSSKINIKRINMKKYNNFGFSHHFLLPVIVFVLVGVMGVAVAHNQGNLGALSTRSIGVENGSQITKRTKIVKLVQTYNSPSDLAKPQGCKAGLVKDDKSDFCRPTVGALNNSCKKSFGPQWVYLNKSSSIDRQAGKIKFVCENRGNKTAKSQSSTVKKENKSDSNYKKVNNGISKATCLSKGRVWAKDSCQRDCSKYGYAVTNLPGNQIDYCYKIGGKGGAANSAVDKNGISQKMCRDSLHRVWKTNTSSCSKVCQAGYSLVSGVKYDRCVKK